MKHIIFILPRLNKKTPIGGYKVVFEYANQMVKNYKVSILYPCFKYNVLGKKMSFHFILRKFICFCFRKLFKTYKNIKWFNLQPNVGIIYCYKITKKIAEKYKDALFVATAIETSYDLKNIGITKTNGFYLIQDFENWYGVTDRMVLDSYRFPLNKICISPWLVDKVASVGESAKLIPNGFDFEYFKLTNPIENRNPCEIAMLNHLDDRKRCEDAYAALAIVKQKIPELHVNVFGVPPRPGNLPDWYSYYQRPNKEQHNYIYNTAAIFVAASKAEGMALPPAEAMQCGVALCCTDIPGFALYAKDKETALLSKVFDIEELAANILKLINDTKLRIQIAKKGNEFIKQFTWEKAANSFVRYIEECTLGSNDV